MSERLSGEPVRDLVPHHKTKEGFLCQVQVLDEASYARALRSRLQDELRTYINRPTLEGLAELQEITEALSVCGHPGDERDLGDVRARLVAELGSYENRQVMVSCLPAPQGLDYEAEDAVVVSERPQLDG